MAIGIVSFALVSMLAVMSFSLVAHQDSSTDSVFSIMTETALQEVRNYNSSVVSAAAAGAYNFNRLQNYTGYIYFDADGQITADAYMIPGSIAVTASTTGTQSTDVGVNMKGTSFATNPGYRSVPLTGALGAAALPAGSYYTCMITTTPATDSTGAMSPNAWVVKLSFSWPPGRAVPAVPVNNFPRVIIASISNLN